MGEGEQGGRARGARAMAGHPAPPIHSTATHHRSASANQQVSGRAGSCRGAGARQWLPRALHHPPNPLPTSFPSHPVQRHHGRRGGQQAALVGEQGREGGGSVLHPGATRRGAAAGADGASVAGVAGGLWSGSEAAAGAPRARVARRLSRHRCTTPSPAPAQVSALIARAAAPRASSAATAGRRPLERARPAAPAPRRRRAGAAPAALGAPPGNAAGT